MALLEVNHLSVQLQTQRGPAVAVRDVSFSLERGQTLGLIGESGCGKSITALALMGLLPDSAVLSGSIRFDQQELVGMNDAGLRRLRGDRIGMIFQEPMTALNPVHTIGHQVAEPLRLHRGHACGVHQLPDHIQIPGQACRIFQSKQVRGTGSSDGIS